MRPTRLAVAALAALLLTACSDSDDDSGDSGGGSGDACVIDRLGVVIGSASVAPAAGDTGDVPVSLTNQSAPCTLDGTPGAALVDGDTTTTVPAASGATSEKLTLAKGESATFTLTYVRGGGSGGTGLAAKTLRISLPGESDEVKDFPWSYGTVALKSDGGDRPDASVGPFTRAGD